MNVGSLLEIYTTMFGWSVYDAIYDLFRATGILLFPFIWMIIKNWKEPVQSQNEKAASVTSQTRVFWDTLAMLTVFIVAVVPAFGLDLNEVRYRVACTDQTGAQNIFETNGGATGTTYDTQLAAINQVRIPLIWWLTTSVGSGVNAAVSSSFQCFEDIKGLDMQLRNLTIQDPDLRSEYMRFANECFLPAKSKYTKAMRGGKHYNYVSNEWDNFLSSPSFNGVLGGYIAQGRAHDDWAYIGSHFFLNTRGFYKEYDQRTCENLFSGCGFKATDGVPGWPVNQSRDRYTEAELQAQDPSKPLYGKPYCDEWWEDNNRGLKKKLLTSVEASQDVVKPDPSHPNESFFDRFKRVVQNAYAGAVNSASKYYFTETELEDIVIKNYVTRDPPQFLADKGGWLGENDFADVRTDSTAQAYEKVIAGVGGAVFVANPAVAKAVFSAAGKGAADVATTFAGNLADFYISMFVAKQAAPMVQAVVLMMVYMLLLFYLLMSNYEIEAVIQMIFIILGIQFFTTLWNFADYLDARLFVSMHPDATMLGSVFTMGINRLLLDAVLTLLYIVAPFLLLWIMGMAGSRIGGLSAQLGGLKKAPKSNAGSKALS